MYESESESVSVSEPGNIIVIKPLRMNKARDLRQSRLELSSRRFQVGVSDAQLCLVADVFIF